LRTNPLFAIVTKVSLLAGTAAILLVALLWDLGMGSLATGVAAGWFAGTLNMTLLALRVSRLTARSTVSGFLYGTASRFALVAVIFLVAYRLAGSNPIGFAIGLTFVILASLPVSVLITRRGAA